MNLSEMASIGTILGKVPSGLFILTARQEDLETGMLASWVMQAGFEPPMVTVAVKQGRYVAEWLSAGKPFLLHVLGESHKSLLSHFGRGFEPGEPAFEGLKVTRTASGLPALADSLGYLECQPKGHVDSGDHRIFAAEIIAGTMNLEGEQPYVHIRRNGLKY
jgi:flavin reductase (DIM6/NTAB) family NADH-FMN oxidoreductase RutF